MYPSKRELSESPMNFLGTNQLFRVKLGFTPILSFLEPLLNFLKLVVLGRTDGPTDGPTWATIKLLSQLRNDRKSPHTQSTPHPNEPDKENPASVQAIFADIFVGNCGHFQKYVKLWTNFETICQIYSIWSENL